MTRCISLLGSRQPICSCRRQPSGWETQLSYSALHQNIFHRAKANTSHPESMRVAISRRTFSGVLSIVYAPESISPFRQSFGIARSGLPQPNGLTIEELHGTRTGLFQTQHEVHFQKWLLNMRPWPHFTRPLTPLGLGPFHRSLRLKFSLQVGVLLPALIHQVACPFAMGALLGRTCALGRPVSWSCSWLGLSGLENQRLPEVWVFLPTLILHMPQKTTKRTFRPFLGDRLCDGIHTPVILAAVFSQNSESQQKGDFRGN